MDVFGMSMPMLEGIIIGGAGGYYRRSINLARPVV